MSTFIWVCLGLGLVAGLLESWTNNQNYLKLNVQKNENQEEIKGFNSKKTGVILIIAVAILGVIAIYCFSNLGSNNFFSNNKKYEDIAKRYIEQSSEEYYSYMILVDTSSYSLDKEIRVTLKYRFTEGPNISYLTYLVIIDKDTEQVIGLSKR